MFIRGWCCLYQDGVAMNEFHLSLKHDIKGWYWRWYDGSNKPLGHSSKKFESVIECYLDAISWARGDASPEGLYILCGGGP